MRFTARFNLLFAFLLSVALWGENTASSHTTDKKLQPADTNRTVEEDKSSRESKPIVVEDRSGLSTEELSERAKELDKEKKRLKIKDVVEAIDENGTVSVTKFVKEKTFAPEPRDGYDWIKTKYGDWLIGHVRSMYKKDLEFDSKEFGIYTFKFNDIVEMKTYAPMQVNIDNVAIFKGVLRLKGDKITIITGDHTYTFKRDMIVAIAPAKEREIHKWAGDFSLNIDLRKGNIQQENIDFKGNLERRTPKSRFAMNYLGRFSKAGEQKTANDNRFNVRYDLFYTKKFFFTPVLAEFYNNEFQNIDKQYTLGLGIGYTIFDTRKIKWDVAAGPAYLHTRYMESDRDKLYDDAISFEAFTKYEYKFNRLNKVIMHYQLTLTKKTSGRYKHHSDLTLENDIVKDRIFINTSLIWDYIDSPQSAEEVTPLKSDYQLIVGAGLRF